VKWAETRSQPDRNPLLVGMKEVVERLVGVCLAVKGASAIATGSETNNGHRDNDNARKYDS